jgi:lipoprotein-anchoring transpeptidase ErfK/SrfK
MMKFKFPFYPLLAVLLLCLSAGNTYAQSNIVDPKAPIKNLKLISETSDGKGHVTRVIQYNKGNIKITETIFITKGPTLAELRRPIKADTLVKSQLEIIVSKSSYRVGLYYRNKLIRSYKAVFGPNPHYNKLMEGDRNTPEGSYTISGKHGSSQYNKFMLLSYPTASNYKKFNELKANGKIPATAKIGGSIGIHGIWNGGDDMIEMGVGWTDGCVAIKNHDIEELYSLVGVGTRVTIHR